MFPPPDVSGGTRGSPVALDVSEALDQVVALSRRLGAPGRDLVILSEGNTSVALDDATFLVKASGAPMSEAADSDFAELRLAPLLEAVVDDGDVDTDELFLAARIAGGPPSIETFVHVAALVFGRARWVAHTHPTSLTGLLCSPEGVERLLAGPVFPDEVVVCGAAPLYVRYSEPGISLGRAVARLLRDHVARHEQAPRMILLENHGLVALGASAAEVEAITLMASKAATVRAVALAAGSLRTLSSSTVAELATRPDELHRRGRLARETGW